MDQGIISALKRRYIRRYLEVLVIPQEDEADHTGARTLISVKAYTIRFALHNFTRSWDAMKVSTLASCCKKFSAEQRC